MPGKEVKIDLNSDLVITRKIVQGDQEAFNKLVEAYQHRLYSFTLKMIHTREDAEEIVQETFLKAYRSLWRFDGRTSFSTWLFTIALNLCKSLMKSKKAFLISMDDEAFHSGEVSAATTDQPEELFLLSEYRREARKLMAFLKPDQKAALILKYMQGLTYHEIAEVLKTSEEAAKMKVYRAKKEILKRYKPAGGVK